PTPTPAPAPAPAPTPTPTPTPTATPTPTPTPNPGPTKTTQTLTGYASGGALVTTSGGEGSSVSSGGSTRVRVLSINSNVSISTDATNNQVKGTFTVPNLIGRPSTATLQLGGGADRIGPTGAFVDDKTYAMRTQTGDPTRQSMLQTPSGSPQLLQ